MNPRAPALTHTGSAAERGLSAPTAGKKRSPGHESRALPRSAVSYKPRRRGAGPSRGSPGAVGILPARFGGISLSTRVIPTSVRSPSAGEVKRSEQHPGQGISTTLTRHQRIPLGSTRSWGRRAVTAVLPCLELAPNARRWGRSPPGPPPRAAGPSRGRKRPRRRESCCIFPLNEGNGEKREKKNPKTPKACWKKKLFSRPKIRGVFFCWELKKKVAS